MNALFLDNTALLPGGIAMMTMCYESLSHAIALAAKIASLLSSPGSNYQKTCASSQPENGLSLSRIVKHLAVRSGRCGGSNIAVYMMLYTRPTSIQVAYIVCHSESVQYYQGNDVQANLQGPQGMPDRRPPTAPAQQPAPARTALLSMLQQQHSLRHGGHFPGGPNPPGGPPHTGSGPPPLPGGSYPSGAQHPMQGPAHGQFPGSFLPGMGNGSVHGPQPASPDMHFRPQDPRQHQQPGMPAHAGSPFQRPQGMPQLPTQMNGVPTQGLPGGGGVFGAPGGNLAQLFLAAQLQVCSLPFWFISDKKPAENCVRVAICKCQRLQGNSDVRQAADLALMRVGIDLQYRSQPCGFHSSKRINLASLSSSPVLRPSSRLHSL